MKISLLKWFFKQNDLAFKIREQLAGNTTGLSRQELDAEKRIASTNGARLSLEDRVADVVREPLEESLAEQRVAFLSKTNEKALDLYDKIYPIQDSKLSILKSTLADALNDFFEVIRDKIFGKSKISPDEYFQQLCKKYNAKTDDQRSDLTPQKKLFKDSRLSAIKSTLKEVLIYDLCRTVKDKIAGMELKETDIVCLTTAINDYKDLQRIYDTEAVFNWTDSPAHMEELMPILKAQNPNFTEFQLSKLSILLKDKAFITSMKVFETLKHEGKLLPPFFTKVETAFIEQLLATSS